MARPVTHGFWVTEPGVEGWEVGFAGSRRGVWIVMGDLGVGIGIGIGVGVGGAIAGQLVAGGRILVSNEREEARTEWIFGGMDDGTLDLEVLCEIHERLM